MDSDRGGGTDPEPTPDPELDLVIDRFVGAPVERVWAAWVTPEHLVRWFAPHPFTTTDAEIDPRPGGVFRTVMRSPQGRTLESIGCYLRVVEHERLVWTTVLGRGFRPAPSRPGRPMTVIVRFAAASSGSSSGTAYSLLAMHGDAGTRRRHADQGFNQGWGVAFDQLDRTLE